MRSTLLQFLSRDWADKLLIALFVALLCVPWVVQRFELAPAAGLVEERRGLAVRPRLEVSWRGLADYPRSFDAYYDDHFGLRDQVIRTYHRFMVRELGVSSNPDVILGKDGWLFYGAAHAVDLYRSPEPFSDEELERWRLNLVARQEWLAGKGIPYLVVIAPDKATLYPEYLPDWLTPARRETRTDQLLAFLHATTDLAIVDLREPLRRAKKQHPHLLYLKADTHWNDLGAFLAYREMMAALAAWLPDLEARELSDYRLEYRLGPDADLADMLAMRDHFAAEHPVLVPQFVPRARFVPPRISGPDWQRLRLRHAYCSETDRPQLPRAVVFHDSFFYAIIPYFAENFSRALYLHLRHDRFAPDLVEREAPDVVVQQFAERWLGRMAETEETLF